MHGNPSAPANAPVAQARHGQDDRLAYSVARPRASRRWPNDAVPGDRRRQAPRDPYPRPPGIPRSFSSAWSRKQSTRRELPRRGVARMWHDAWPPLPPGGHRPPDAPPFTSPGDQLLAVGLGAAAGAGALVWATGQAAGLAFGHTWLELSPADVAHVLWHLPAALERPRPGLARRGARAAARPGRHVRHLHRPGRRPLRRDRRGPAAPARPGRRPPARPPEAGQACRRLGGRSGAAAADRGRARAGPGDPGPHPRRSSAGCWRPRTATRSWSSAPPAATRPRPWSSPPSWNGPAPWSPPRVKPDLLRATMAHRARLGQVLVIDPLGASGVQAARWSPAGLLFDLGGGPADRRPAGQCDRADPHRGAAARAPVLEDHGHQVPRPHALSPPPPRAWAWPRSCTGSTAARTRRSRTSWRRPGCRPRPMPGSPASTAPTGPWTRCMPRPRRSCRLRQPARLRLHRRPRPGPGPLPGGNNTIYLYAPAHQQRLLRPLFETITQQVVAAAQEQAALAPDGMLSPRLGLFLDEAGNCAALSDLDVLATTARGQGIQLVTVWHDKSQLEARYGPKASTILNNHRAKLFLSGLADLSALELGARLIGDQALVDRNRSMGSDGRHSTERVDAVSAVAAGGGPAPAATRGGGAAVRAPAADPDPAAALLRAARAGPPRAGRGPRGPAGGADRAAPWPQDRTGLQAPPAPPGPRADPEGRSAGGVAGAGRGPAMTPDQDATATIADQPSRSGRPIRGRRGSGSPMPGWPVRSTPASRSTRPPSPARSAWPPGSPGTWSGCCAPTASATPSSSELRGRLVRDQITDAYLARELPGGQPLDPAELAAEVGTTSHGRPPVAAHPARRPADATGGWPACGPSRPATAAQPPSSCKRCRPPTPTAADPSSRTAARRGGRWSASSSSTRPARSPAVSRSTRPRSPGRSG